MIVTKQHGGSLFEEHAEAFVNPVNCVGVMGKGLALHFKRAFPANCRAYEAHCRSGQMKPGEVFMFETENLASPRWIINFPTKRHWRDPSRIEDIESGLKSMVQEIKTHDIKSIAVPALGCGLGGLDWRKVEPIITDALSAVDDLRVSLFPVLRSHHLKHENRQGSKDEIGR